MVEQRNAQTQKYKATGTGRTIYLNKNVWDAAMERIERVFDEFPNVVVHVSGGKDSTVILNMALEVAARRGRLPLPVFWVDQEAEWQATVDIVAEWMRRDDIDPYWLQIPFRLTNATSKKTQYFHVWDPEREADWMREKDPIAITENIYGVDRFKQIFDKTMGYHFDGPVAALTGIRTEESPGRRLGITNWLAYKDITWGRIANRSKGHYVFHPIYDWSFRDVWKAIFDHGWSYNRIYDEQYRYGVPVREMRISALQHETAIHALFFLQEFEPETYERMCERIDGIDMAGKIGKETYSVPRILPPMFDNWIEYRDYLAEHLLEDDSKAILTKAFKAHQDTCPDWMVEEMCRVHIRAILTNDREQTTLKNWTAQREVRLALREEGNRLKDEANG